MAALPQRSLAQDARRVLEFLGKYPQFDRSRTSRFAVQAKSVLQGHDNTIPPDRSDFDIILEAHRDLAEFNFALDVLGEQNLVDRHSDKLALVLRDAPTPEQSGTETPGRDHQFELFMLAIMKRGGLRPVWRDRGFDIEIRLDGKRVAVEAKRVKSLSPRAVEKTFHRAAKQLEQSQLPAFICLDFSMPARPTRGVLVNPNLREYEWAVKRRMEKFIEDFKPKIEQAIGSRPVVGLVFVDSIRVQDGMNPRSGAGRWMMDIIIDHVVWNCPTPAEQALLRKFSEYFTYGLPNFRPQTLAQ